MKRPEIPWCSFWISRRYVTTIVPHIDETSADLTEISRASMLGQHLKLGHYRSLGWRGHVGNSNLWGRSESSAPIGCSGYAITWEWHAKSAVLFSSVSRSCCTQRLDKFPGLKNVSLVSRAASRLPDLVTNCMHDLDCITMLSVAKLHSIERMNRKWFGRKHLKPDRGTIPASVWVSLCTRQYSNRALLETQV